MYVLYICMYCMCGLYMYLYYVLKYICYCYVSTMNFFLFKIILYHILYPAYSFIYIYIYIPITMTTMTVIPTRTII